MFFTSTPGALSTHTAPTSGRESMSSQLVWPLRMGIGLNHFIWKTGVTSVTTVGCKPHKLDLANLSKRELMEGKAEEVGSPKGWN